MTVKELKAILNQFDDNSIIELTVDPGTESAALEVGEYKEFEFVDWRGNQRTYPRFDGIESITYVVDGKLYHA